MIQFFFILLISFKAFSAEHVTLRSLKDVSSKKLSLRGKDYRVFMVFQEDCSVCHKQVAELSCLSNVTLLGAFSSERGLRKEYRKMKTQYSAYFGSQDALSELGVKQKFTPQTVVTTAVKNFLFQGLTDCEDIKKRMRE